MVARGKIKPRREENVRGSPADPGTSFTWCGNNKVGESRPNKLALCQFEFKRPFEGTNTTEFRLQPQDGQTVDLFVDCEKMVGDQFEEGLANLNGSSQSAAKQ